MRHYKPVTITLTFQWLYTLDGLNYITYDVWPIIINECYWEVHLGTIYINIFAFNTIFFSLRMTYRIGFAITGCITSSARRTPIRTTPTGVFSFHTSAGWCSENIPKSTERARPSTCPTSTTIHWCSFTLSACSKY